MPLHVITGCMFSGKTEELCRLLKRKALARKQVRIFVPERDTRKVRSIDEVLPSMRRIHKPVRVASPLDMLKFIRKKDKVVAVDEVQFWHDEKEIKEFKEFLNKVWRTKTVFISGLDTDFRHQPFGVMPYLLAVADKVTKLTAVCFKCGSEATYTQRLINSKPASPDSPLILIGDSDSYEARCGKCYEI